MKASYIGVVLVAGAALGGCHGSSSWVGDDATPHRGRYSGIGIYSADRTWAKISSADKPADSDKARSTVADDQTVIVVVDSNTGEVRQCGNMSGFCIGMNPWTRSLGKPQTNPVDLAEHAPEKVFYQNAADTSVSNEADVDNKMSQ